MAFCKSQISCWVPSPESAAIFLAEALFDLFGIGDNVELVQDEPARLVVERFVIEAKLLDDCPRFAKRPRDRVFVGIMRGNVNDMQQNTGASQVT